MTLNQFCDSCTRKDSEYCRDCEKEWEITEAGETPFYFSRKLKKKQYKMSKDQLKDIIIKGHEADTIQHLMLWVFVNHIKDIPESEHAKLREIQKMLVEKFYGTATNTSEQILEILKRHEEGLCPKCGKMPKRTLDAMNPSKCHDCNIWPSYDINSWFEEILKIYRQKSE